MLNRFFFLSNLGRNFEKFQIIFNLTRVRTTNPGRRPHLQCSPLYMHMSSLLLRLFCRQQTLNIHHLTCCTNPALKGQRESNIWYQRLVCANIYKCVCGFTFAMGAIAFISSHTQAGSSRSLRPCYTAAAEANCSTSTAYDTVVAVASLSSACYRWDIYLILYWFFFYDFTTTHFGDSHQFIVGGLRG